MGKTESREKEEPLSFEAIKEFYMQDAKELPALYELENPCTEQIAKSAKWIFRPNIIESWWEMTAEERWERAKLLAKTFNYWNGTNASILLMSYGMTDDDSWGLYHPNKNQVYVDDYLLEDPLWFGYLVNTISHEMEHAYQQAALEDPETYNIQVMTAKRWKWNADNYVCSERDYWKYCCQPLERDADNMANFITQMVLGEEDK